MPFFGWIRDLFGLRKDYVETEKAVLEIEKLEAEERARNLITPATLDDVKKYDPKYKRIRSNLHKRRGSLFKRNEMREPYYLSFVDILKILLLLLVLLSLILILIKVIARYASR
jgi:hypothetical protein